jgi:hypothetical protein
MEGTEIKTSSPSHQFEVNKGPRVPSPSMNPPSIINDDSQVYIYQLLSFSGPLIC